MSVLALLPCDTSTLPKVAELPEPTKEHTLTACDDCGRECWILPDQRVALRLSVIMDKRISKLCYYCVIDAMQGGDLDVRIVGVKQQEPTIRVVVVPKP